MGLKRRLDILIFKKGDLVEQMARIAKCHILVSKILHSKASISYPCHSCADLAP